MIELPQNESRFRPFEPLPFTERSSIDSQGGIVKEADAHAALQTRLAQQGLRGVTPEVAEVLLLRFGVQGAVARKILIEIWQHAFKKLLFRDDQVDAGETQYLTELKKSLGLTDDEIKTARSEVPEV
jgi:hypothetical protein